MAAHNGIGDGDYPSQRREQRGVARMSGRHPFTELTNDFTPERRQRIDRMKNDLLEAARGRSAASADAGVDEHIELPLWLIVTGPLAGGKTTLVRRISQDLAIPLFEKDALKDELYRTLGHGDRDWSRQIGLTAISLLFSIAYQVLQSGSSVVTEANFYRQFDSERAAEVLQQVRARVVQLHCSASPEILVERNARRRTSAKQWPGHHVMPDEELLEGIEAGTWEPLDIPSEIIRVDSSTDIDYLRVLRELRIEQIV